MEQLTIPITPVLTFVLVLARVGGLVTFAPFWSHRAAPVRVRAVLALMLALVLMPAVAGRVPAPPTHAAALMLALAGELLVGCALGFVGRLVFAGLEVAAQALGSLMGFSLAATVDPSTHASTTALGTIAQMVGMMILLGADGHHWALAATVKSFYVVPAGGGFAVSPALLELFVRLSADALAVGVALAAPAFVVMLATEFALAVAGRALPQLQIMVLGFPLKIAIGLWLIGASLYFMPGALRTALAAMRGGLERALSAM